MTQWSLTLNLRLFNLKNDIRPYVSPPKKLRLYTRNPSAFWPENGSQRCP